MSRNELSPESQLFHCFRPSQPHTLKNSETVETVDTVGEAL